jgi:hypothetical protein
MDEVARLIELSAGSLIWQPLARLVGLRGVES